MDLLHKLPALDKIIWEGIEHFYVVDKRVDKVDITLLRAQLVLQYPKTEKMIDLWFRELPEVSGDNVMEYLQKYKESIIMEEISIAAVSKNKNKILQLVDTFPVLSTTDKTEYSVYEDNDLSDFISRFKRENLIKLLPAKPFDIALDGGIPRGTCTNILVFARVESGKTAFAINSAFGFCRQGLRVMYIGNEDSAERLLLRFASRFASTTDDMWPKSRILQDTPGVIAKARTRGWQNLKLVALSPGTVADLWKLAEQKIDVMIVDQIRKILSPGEKEESANIAAASAALRDIGKKYNLITMPVTQANDRMYRILGMSDIYMSKVAVPGDYDLMLGIGMDEDYKTKNWRTINICKNKLGGGHSSFDVKILPEYSMFSAL